VQSGAGGKREQADGREPPPPISTERDAPMRRPVDRLTASRGAGNFIPGSGWIARFVFDESNFGHVTVRAGHWT